MEQSAALFRTLPLQNSLDNTDLQGKKMTNDNGKVTIAVLGEKIDTLIKSSNDQKKSIDAVLALVNQNKQDIALQGLRSTQTDKEVSELAQATEKAISSLNNKFTAFSGANGFLAVVAASLAVAFGNK
jgi:hypothetical protein